MQVMSITPLLCAFIRNLCDTDILSKSDPPVVVVFEKTHDNSWRELGRTEVIQNTLNPDFVKKIVIEYHFEEQQRLNFAVYVFDEFN
ncbi:hypothetical protein T265_06235 [Opisthorchis viverrini]|uniref:C2 domain-containing protein n=1 Tax=Opisthorchis viverrini TaxID=6198 RepID=A0A074ZT06_OPIVI|nr:hypothetical protein T265_06235 [Opisthorchis viverrini]KER26515.1 hypothetical protein T265_06235 [Opisthorchis viverrini]